MRCGCTAGCTVSGCSDSSVASSGQADGKMCGRDPLNSPARRAETHASFGIP